MGSEQRSGREVTGALAGVGRAGGGRNPAELPALRFADAARRLTAAARASGLAPPGFRSPPRVAGAVRSIRRAPGGSVVSVRLRDRPFAQVMGDMVEGVLVANRVEGEARVRLRAHLERALAPSRTEVAA